MRTGKSAIHPLSKKTNSKPRTLAPDRPANPAVAQPRREYLQGEEPAQVTVTEASVAKQPVSRIRTTQMLPREQPQGIIQKFISKTVISSDGYELGTAAQTFNSKLTDVPEWLMVESGFLHRARLIVPLAGASVTDDAVIVPYGRDRVTMQPQVRIGDALQTSDEDLLNDYFELGANGAHS
jgi:hypothetical protein